MATQAAPSIWYGNHGPMPAVSTAEANMLVAPSAKPKPAPKTRPPRTRRKNITSIPPVPAPRGRRTASTADRTPSIATAFASIPPSAISARTTTSMSGRRMAKSIGASRLWPATAECSSTRRGHRFASNPTRLTTRIVAALRGFRRTALVAFERAARFTGRAVPARPSGFAEACGLMTALRAPSAHRST